MFGADGRFLPLVKKESDERVLGSVTLMGGVLWGKDMVPLFMALPPASLLVFAVEKLPLALVGVVLLTVWKVELVVFVGRVLELCHNSGYENNNKINE